MSSNVPSVETQSTSHENEDSGSTTMPWRAKVKFLEGLPKHCVDFLDKHHTNKNLEVSAAGLIRLTDTIGAMVPYEICPQRVKTAIRKITPQGSLPRTAFPRKVLYESALCNLYTYGYLQDVEETVIERRRAISVARKRWCKENPENVKKYIENAKRLQEQRRIESSRE